MTPERELKKQAYDKLINQIAIRYQIHGIIRILVAVLQVLIGILLAWSCYITHSANYMPVVFCIGLGLINIGIGVGDVTYISELRKNPRGVLDSVRPMAGTIVNMVFCTICTVTIGVGPSIFYLIVVRRFVLRNEDVIKEEY